MMNTHSMMGADTIEQWDLFKGEARWQWDKFSDDTLTEIEGCREKLAAKICEVYGIATEDARTQIEEFEMRCKKRCKNDFV